ncbi:hypothetical protein Ciccas_008471 [Cichlidogyrus casuarinus]|uniref:Uncharacterized protein n=1 Tax=Cichlidogyrus casuarinus TaxID=1844966 RepID=A0ABD2Q0Q5_9PLAT
MIFEAKSHQQRMDFDNRHLCAFSDDMAPLKDRVRSQFPKVLIRRTSPYNKAIETSKCKFYQIQLTGLVRIRQRKELLCETHLSDFNEKLGSSGDFDDQLRVSTNCSGESKRGFISGTHQCLSLFEEMDTKLSKSAKYKQLITRIPGTKRYFCWLVTLANESWDKVKIALFDFPHCAFTRNSELHLVADEQKALAIFDLKSEQLRARSLPGEGPTSSTFSHSGIKVIQQSFIQAFPVNNGYFYKNVDRSIIVLAAFLLFLYGRM